MGMRNTSRTSSFERGKNELQMVCTDLLNTPYILLNR